MLVYWMIWYCYCFLSGFKGTFSCIVQYSLCHNMDIGIVWHCTLVSSTPSQSMGLFLSVHWSGVECHHVLLDIILFHHDFHHDSCDYHRDFMAINYFLNYTLGFLYLSSSVSENAQLPECFRPWTFSLNIGLNMLPLGSFMTCLHSLLGYSTRGFQALQLIVLAVFGAVDYSLASCMLVHFLEIYLNMIVSL